jgi:hypothetical protein
MNVKDYLKNLVENGIDFYDLPYELEVENWPDVEDEDGNKESLDMENFEWLSIDDDQMVIACGGDWQDPQTLTIKMVNGELTVVETEDGFSSGISEEEFYAELGIENEDYYDDNDYDEL